MHSQNVACCIVALSTKWIVIVEEIFECYGWRAIICGLFRGSSLLWRCDMITERVNCTDLSTFRYRCGSVVWSDNDCKVFNTIKGYWPTPIELTCQKHCKKHQQKACSRHHNGWCEQPFSIVLQKYDVEQRTSVSRIALCCLKGRSGQVCRGVDYSTSPSKPAAPASFLTLFLHSFEHLHSITVKSHGLITRSLALSGLSKFWHVSVRGTPPSYI